MNWWWYVVRSHDLEEVIDATQAAHDGDDEHEQSHGSEEKGNQQHGVAKG